MTGKSRLRTLSRHARCLEPDVQPEMIVRTRKKRKGTASALRDFSIIGRFDPIFRTATAENAKSDTVSTKLRTCHPRLDRAKLSRLRADADGKPPACSRCWRR